MSEHSTSDLYLLDMVRQHCERDGKYDSGFIRINAEVLNYLCKQGLLRPSPGYEAWDGFYRGFEAMETDPPADGIETIPLGP